MYTHKQKCKQSHKQAKRTEKPSDFPSVRLFDFVGNLVAGHADVARCRLMSFSLLVLPAACCIVATNIKRYQQNTTTTTTTQATEFAHSMPRRGFIPVAGVRSVC